MKKVLAYAKLLRIPGIRALGIVPVMLFSIIDILPAVLLIIIPIAWYVLCTSLLGEKLFKPRI